MIFSFRFIVIAFLCLVYSTSVNAQMNYEAMDDATGPAELTFEQIFDPTTPPPSGDFIGEYLGGICVFDLTDTNCLECTPEECPMIYESTWKWILERSD